MMFAHSASEYISSVDDSRRHNEEECAFLSVEVGAADHHLLTFAHVDALADSSLCDCGAGIHPNLSFRIEREIVKANDGAFCIAADGRAQAYAVVNRRKSRIGVRSI